MIDFLEQIRIKATREYIRVCMNGNWLSWYVQYISQHTLMSPVALRDSRRKFTHSPPIALTAM